MSVISEVVYELASVERALENYEKSSRKKRETFILPTYSEMRRRIERAIDLLQRMASPAIITSEDLEAFGWRKLYTTPPDYEGDD